MKKFETMKVYLKLTLLFVALNSLISLVDSQNQLDLMRISRLVGSSHRPPYPFTPLLRLVNGLNGRNLLNFNARHQSKRLTNNACHSNPCNGANTICRSMSLGNFQCVCKPGFVSILDSPFYGCTSDPCNNRCTSPHTACYTSNSTSYECVCIPGYRPLRQSIEGYGCELDPCNSPVRGDIQVTCRACEIDGNGSDDSDCGGTMMRNGPNGMIQSPDYPEDFDTYPCLIWTLEAPECSRIQISISDLEISDDQYDYCNNGYLQIRYGNTPTSFKRHELCMEEPELPYLLTSTSRHMEILLYGDTGTPHRGFKLNYGYVEQ